MSTRRNSLLVHVIRMRSRGARKENICGQVTRNSVTPLRGGEMGAYFIQNVQRHLCDQSQLPFPFLRASCARGFGYSLLLTPSFACGSLWCLDLHFFIGTGIYFTGVAPLRSLSFGSCAATTDHGSSNGGDGSELSRLALRVQRRSIDRSNPSFPRSRRITIRKAH